MGFGLSGVLPSGVLPWIRVVHKTELTLMNLCFCIKHYLYVFLAIKRTSNCDLQLPVSPMLLVVIGQTIAKQSTFLESVQM